MRVVSNTSPISNLAIIGRLDLLKRRYGKIQIPPAVFNELNALTHVAARAGVTAALAEGWLTVQAVPLSPPAQLSTPLDAGETEAIWLARQIKADVLLIDGRRGRAAARTLSLAVGGLLGELLHAKHARWIPALKPEIEKLRTEAGFYLDAEIERFILTQASE